MINSYTVTVTTDGRSGHVHYSEGLSRTFAFYWEFSGGDVVAAINVPKSSEWDAKLPWAANRRDEVLARVAAEVRRQQCPTCEPRIGDSWIDMMQQ